MKIFAYLTFCCLFLAACEEAPRERPTFKPFNQKISEPEIDTGEFEIPQRPDGDVYLQSGHCGCQDGKPITLGNCVSFCEGKSGSEPTLYVDVEVGEDIETSHLVDLAGWCGQNMIYTDPETGEVVEDTSLGNPSCEIQVKDENGSLGSLPLNDPAPGQKSLEINILNLDPDKTYRLNVVEVSSGASSNTIQVRKVSTPITDPVGGPLRLMPVNQYSCMNRESSGDDSTGDTYFESANRMHYYFIDEDRPEPLPGTFANVYCHDYITYGTTPINNPLLEESPDAFTVWDKWDPRFFDLDGDENGNEMEIHKIIEQNINNQGVTLSQTPKVFFELKYYNGPPITDPEGGGGQQDQRLLGYYMLPYVDSQTFKAYCPTQDHYNSSNPLFSAMKEVVAVNTEGLYIAKQDNVCDYLLIKESLLKQIWFYTENGQRIQPNSDTVTGKQIQFF
ncbi:MAG: hypothetical protein WEB87_00560, partial [Bacteriovoracaceae bacterium]